MSTTKLIGTSIYAVIGIYINVIAYIYVVSGLGCNPALGIGSVSANAIILFSFYHCIIRFHHAAIESRQSRQLPIIIRAKQPMPIILPVNQPPKEEDNDQKEEHQAEVVAECREYMEHVIAPLFPENASAQLVELVDDFANKRICYTSIDVSLEETAGLRVQDIYHLVWNLWKRLATLNRRQACRFAKNAFPAILKDINEETIYRKMTDSCHCGPIQPIDINEPLVATAKVTVTAHHRAVI